MSAPLRSEDLFNQWQRDQWSFIYLFAGQEDYLIDQAFKQALDHWLEPAEAALNFDRFDGDAVEANTILQACQTMPFLSKRRVVRVDNAAKLSAGDQTLLANTLPNLSPETSLILVWGKEWKREDAKKALVESVSEHGQVVIFWPLFPEQAQRWVIQRAKHHRKEISSDAAVWLVQNRGEGLRMLDQEILKASLFVAQKPTIELDDIQASLGYAKLHSPFDWVSAIRSKDAKQAVFLTGHLLEEGEEPLRLLALVSRGLRDWWTAKNSGENASLMAMRFHLKRGEENKFLKDLGRWSENDLIAGLDACLNAEQSIKTGKETPAISLTLLTLSLCGLQTGYALC